MDSPPLIETVLVVREHAFLESVGVLAPYASLTLNEQLRQTEQPEHEPRQCLQLRPFFRKSENKLNSDGNGLEEGEGRGPLLEYFGLVGAQLADESSCANKTSTTAKGTGCEHSGITNYQTISMLGYHQGSEALWFAESDAAAQALELQMVGQGCKASEATDQLSETTSIMPLNADEDEAKGQIDVGADALSQLSEDWRDEDPTSLGAVAILAERWCAAGDARYRHCCTAVGRVDRLHLTVPHTRTRTRAPSSLTRTNTRASCSLSQSLPSQHTPHTPLPLLPLAPFTLVRCCPGRVPAGTRAAWRSRASRATTRPARTSRGCATAT